MMSVFFLVLGLGELALGLVFTVGWIFYFIAYDSASDNEGYDNVNVRHRVMNASQTGTSFGNKDDDSLMVQYSVANDTNELARNRVKDQNPTATGATTMNHPNLITPGVDGQGQPIDSRKIQKHFEDFYEDIYEELHKFGEIESLNICDNLTDHMVGNVYVQFTEEDQAATALKALQGRFYSGCPIIANFSPVTDFREAICRQFEENNCNRGGYCNFMHVKQIGRDLRKKLYGSYHRHSTGSRSRSRSMSPHRRRHSEGLGDYRDRGDYYGNCRRSADRHGRYDSNGGRRRHGSPRHTGSSAREGNEEQRARIEEWNREREGRH
ncbi:hypothetical protein IFM89_011795 [Coptis chinensis]|uniref:Uncharacterized protein n=1 Tax=Coptis chinensis TaxID=261450 RepID=A0A835LET5_9MAGN|nr:hypothetical protein IFM89_011795 [Coptis chinensis]